MAAAAMTPHVEGLPIEIQQMNSYSSSSVEHRDMQVQVMDMHLESNGKQTNANTIDE